MKLSRTSFYHKLKDKSQVEMQRDADLRGRIEAICLEYPRYGYRRVTEQLKREGLGSDHKKVLRLMRESDLLCRGRRRWVNTTESKHRFPRYPNLVKGMAITVKYTRGWRSGKIWLWDFGSISTNGYRCLSHIRGAFCKLYLLLQPSLAGLSPTKDRNGWNA